MARLDIARQENRIMDAILYYQSEKIGHQSRQSRPSQLDNKAILLELQYYQALLAANNKRLNPQEKATRRYLKYHIRTLKLKARPNLWNFLLRNKPLQLLRAWVFGNYNNIQQQELQILAAQKQVSTQYSLTNIHQQLQQTGFTQNINPYLQKMMEQGIDRFHYRYMDIRHPDTEYILYFSKGPGTDMYKFDRFEAAALPPWQQQAHSRPQYYSFNSFSGIDLNATEAAQLVNGRAVAIDGVKNQWIQLDKANAARPFQIVNFDLEAALKQTPLPPMTSIEYNQFIEALRSGEKKEVTYNHGETLINYTLQVSPSQQAIYITDKNGQLVNPRDLNNNQQPTKAEQFLQQAVSVNQEYTPRLSRV